MSRKIFGKRIAGLLMAMILVVGMIAMAVVPASATINDAVRADTDGVLMVEAFVYVTGSIDVQGTTTRYDHTNIATVITKNTANDDYYIGTGTAFLINDDTAITCAHVVDHTMWEAEPGTDVETILAAMEQYKNLGFTVEVECKFVVNKDVTVSGKVISKSVQDDYAIVKLDQTLGGKTPLKLADSSKVTTTQTVYSLGFPGTVSNVERGKEGHSNRTNDSSDVTISEGTIQKVTTLNNTAVIQHSATIAHGNSGGPLVDENGRVIGVNKWVASNGNDYYWATSINEVKKVLKSLNIPYEDAGDIIPEPDTLPETKPETQPETKPETQPETQPATDNGSSGPNWIVIAIIALVVVLIAVVVVIIIVVSKKNKGNGPKGGSGNYPNQPQMPNRQNPQGPVGPSGVNPAYGNNAFNRGPAPAPVNDGAGETSVLNDGAGETTVLGGQATGFALVRKANGQRISINKPEFVIGKERRRVDYCIENNSSVSRTHARIKVRGGQCFVADLGSTNATFVNGARLTPNQDVAIKKGDTIKVADEEFELV